MGNIQSKADKKAKAAKQDHPRFTDWIEAFAEPQGITEEEYHAQIKQNPQQYQAMQAVDSVLQTDAARTLLGQPAAWGLYRYFYMKHSGASQEDLKQEEERILTDIRGELDKKKSKTDEGAIRALVNEFKALVEKEINEMNKAIKAIKIQKKTKGEARYGGGYTDLLDYNYYGEGNMDLFAYNYNGGSRAGRFGGISNAHRVTGDSDYLYGNFDDNYGYHDYMGMLEFGDGDKAARYAGYSQAGHYHNNRGERNQLYRSRQRGRNLYHRRGLQEIASFESNGFKGEHMESLPMIILVVFLMAVVCIFGAVFYNRYQKNKSEGNDEDKMVVIQAKNNEEDQV